MQLDDMRIEATVTKLVESLLKAVFVKEITDDDSQSSPRTPMQLSLNGLFQVRGVAGGRQLFQKLHEWKNAGLTPRDG